jgi:hypothetical protein
LKNFNDLGEQQASNIYDMVVLTVEKPILEVVMHRADGNQSHAARRCWALTAIPCARNYRSTACCKRAVSGISGWGRAVAGRRQLSCHPHRIFNHQSSSYATSHD